MALDYATDQIEKSPPWLQGAAGAAWLRAFGSQKDWVWTLIDQAVKARFPLICPADALQFIGEERGLARGPVEPEAQYRSRLQAAWDAWVWAGTPWGLLRAFQLAGYPAPLLQTQSGQQFSLAGTTGTVADLVISPLTGAALGGSPQRWSDIAVFIAQPWPTWWGGSAPADGSPDQQAASRLILKWKGAHNRCVALKVISGPTWDSGLFWTTSGALYDSGTSVTWTPPTG